MLCFPTQLQRIVRTYDEENDFICALSPSLSPSISPPFSLSLSLSNMSLSAAQSAG